MAANPEQIGHWFGGCDEATKAWRRWLEPWAALYEAGWRRLKRQVFELKLEKLPCFAAEWLVDDSIEAGEKTNNQLDVLFDVVRHFWTGITIAVTHGLWVWRVGLM